MKAPKFNAQRFELSQQDIGAGSCFVDEAYNVCMHEMRVPSIEGRELEKVRWSDRPRVLVNSDLQGSADSRNDWH